MSGYFPSVPGANTVSICHNCIQLCILCSFIYVVTLYILLSTPKCLGDQICQIYPGKSDDKPPWESARMESELFNFQIYLGKTYDEPPQVSVSSKSCIWYTALHSMQLYICCHFQYSVIWS